MGENLANVSEPQFIQLQRKDPQIKFSSVY